MHSNVQNLTNGDRITNAYSIHVHCTNTIASTSRYACVICLIVECFNALCTHSRPHYGLVFEGILPNVRWVTHRSLFGVYWNEIRGIQETSKHVWNRNCVYCTQWFGRSVVHSFLGRCYFFLTHHLYLLAIQKQLPFPGYLATSQYAITNGVFFNLVPTPIPFCVIDACDAYYSTRIARSLSLRPITGSNS